ncbi:MAG: hypothetical protein ACLTAN_05560 [Christensenellaceae bacterium]|nr:hypothetical protein [Bacillota bacterium]
MSENELIEFKDRANFDFLRFRYAQDYEQRELKADCERVAQYARDTVKDLCLLGLRLKEMKAAEQWREVVDETGTPFSYAGFEEFCKYAFGFSQTKVSNLVRIAEFVQVKGDSVNFIERQYAGYSMSQLVELASVPKENRKYFNSAMTVDDMRTVKNYMRDSVGFIYMSDSESDQILEKAKKFREEQNARRAEQKAERQRIMQKPTQEIELSEEKAEDQIPGQTNLFDETADEKIAYYDAAEDLEAEKRTIESAAEEWAQAQEEEAEEAEEKSDVGYKSPRIEIEPCEFISEYPLNVRDGRRAFLADLSKWRACPEKPETEARYFWRFEDETEILVEQKKAFEKSIGDEESATVADFYYVRLSAFGEWIATSKIQLERWLGEKYSERPAQEN